MNTVCIVLSLTLLSLFLHKLSHTLDFYFACSHTFSSPFFSPSTHLRTKTYPPNSSILPWSHSNTKNAHANTHAWVSEWAEISPYRCSSCQSIHIIIITLNDANEEYTLWMDETVCVCVESSAVINRPGWNAVNVFACACKCVTMCFFFVNV